MKQMTIKVDYDETTRVLTSAVTLNGFVTSLPDQVVAGAQVETVMLFCGPIMSVTDAQFIHASIARALLAANSQLADWSAAAANKVKSDMLPSQPGSPEVGGPLPYDPVVEFDHALQT